MIRRAIIVVLVVGASVTAGVAAAHDTRTLSLRNAHTKEELRLQPFGAHGLLEPLAWARLDRLFRSWRTGERRSISPRLLRVLAHIQRRFGGRRLELVSGYRLPENPRRLTSYHQVGHAADIRVAGVEERTVYDYCRQLERVGCGLYPNGHHVHVDSRSHAATWVDLSRYGEPARYVTRPVEWARGHPLAGRGKGGPR